MEQGLKQFKDGNFMAVRLKYLAIIVIFALCFVFLVLYFKSTIEKASTIADDIVKEMDIGSNVHKVVLCLTDVMEEGETETYTVSGKELSLKLHYVGIHDRPVAEFVRNFVDDSGDSTIDKTGWLENDQVYSFNNGLTINVIDIMFGESGTKSMVEFEILK